MFILYFITYLLFLSLFFFFFFTNDKKERASNKLIYNEIYIMNIYTLYIYLYAHYI